MPCIRYGKKPTERDVDREMTDNEIIKALECHSLCTVSKCEECPLFPTNECSAELSGYALDLINRYKTKNEQLDNAIQLLESEIERRKNNLFCKVIIDEETMRSIINDKMAEFELDIKSIKAEAIKEFAKELINRFSKNNLTQGFYVNISEIDLINLVKEKVGEG